MAATQDQVKFSVSMLIVLEDFLTQYNRDESAKADQ